jgi:hypothetical protein
MSPPQETLALYNQMHFFFFGFPQVILLGKVAVLLLRGICHLSEKVDLNSCSVNSQQQP